MHLHQLRFLESHSFPSSWWGSAISEHSGVLVLDFVGGEGHSRAQGVDSTEQELQVSVGGRWSVLRDHVAGKINTDPGEASLSVGSTEDTSACEGGVAWVIMVRHIEWVGWLRLESLLTSPGHVLDHEERTVGDEHHVKSAVANDSTLAALNNTWQYRDSGWRRVVLIIARVDWILTSIPWLDWSIDGLLYI